MGKLVAGVVGGNISMQNMYYHFVQGAPRQDQHKISRGSTLGVHCEYCGKLSIGFNKEYPFEGIKRSLHSLRSVEMMAWLFLHDVLLVLGIATLCPCKHTIFSLYRRCLFFFGCAMTVLYILLALALGTGIGYFIAYTKYGNTEMVDELRSNYKQAQRALEEQSFQHKDIVEQNKILKQQAQMLLNQNEDFSKMVSELSRYYYRIKQGSIKLKELADIMGIYDEQMENKLARIMGEEISFDEQDTEDVEDQKYF